jgi:hypothetical protein
VFPNLSAELRKLLSSFPKEDKIIFNGKQIQIDPSNFISLLAANSSAKIAFVDGGQAEILSAGNFCLSFIRVFAQVFDGEKKTEFFKREFYLLTSASWKNDDLYYSSKIFPILEETLISEEDLLLSSNDASLKSGIERAAPSKITNLARRFSELALAAELQSKCDYVVLDGTLDKTYTHEEKYLKLLSSNVCSLAKSSSLFTVSGNSPVVLLSKLGPFSCWRYFLENQTYFVKLHERAKHVFRFEGNPDVLPHLIHNSHDALFLGYPYGLILADQFARVSNEERSSLRMNLLLKAENKDVLKYLSSSDAHAILDNLG